MIASDYLAWRDLGHSDGCKRTSWDVTTKDLAFYGGRRDHSIRLVCPKPEGCGTFHEWTVSVAPGDDSDNSRTGMATECGPVEYIGYGTAPIKAGNVWLHAGPPLLRNWDGEGPEYFVVTATATRPRTVADVLGIVGPARGKGRQLKSRWFAAGVIDHERYGPSASPKRDDLTSRTAAVRWVLQQAGAASATSERGGS
ncbi:hypothetical protein ACIBG7_43020 [Nonomuraea sp. NPDC050328]|uniref:hypothetical protein n=1 Tax=Nonomuraea sp. NPDC050328 TaxID=3364361 RepID=UPI0037996B11